MDVAPGTASHPPACAPDAQPHGRIVLQPRLGDRVAAAGAEAELALVEAAERGGDAGLLRLPPPLRGERHRLDLHRVHARQAADTVLVEGDRRPVGLAEPFLLVELVEPRRQSLAGPFLVYGGFPRRTQISTAAADARAGGASAGARSVGLL